MGNVFFSDSNAVIYYVVSSIAAVAVIIVLVLLPSLVYFFTKRKQASTVSPTIIELKSNSFSNTDDVDHIYDSISIDESITSRLYEDVVLSVGGIYDCLLHHEHKPVGIYDFLYDRPHSDCDNILWSERDERSIHPRVHLAGLHVDICDVAEAK